MPLIGLKDEKGKNIIWDDVAKGKGVFSDPVPVLIALYGDRDKYCDFSVTELLSDPLSLQLTQRFDYFESVDELLDRTMGSAFHALMEKGFEKMERMSGKNDDMISEKSYNHTIKVKIDGKIRKIKIGGTSDLEVLSNNELWDYKTMTASKLKYMSNGKAKDSIASYTDQMNMYRWLIKKEDGRDILRMKVRAIIRDWRFYEFRRAGFSLLKYPKGCFVKIKIKPLDEVEEMIANLATDHWKASQLKDEELHELDECDVWGGIRCANYCAVSDICPYRLEEASLKAQVKKKVVKKTKVAKKVKKKTKVAKKK